MIRFINKRYSAYYLAGIISLLTLVVYSPALQNDFVIWDDDAYVYDNPHIRSLDSTFLRWAFFDVHAGNWYPLTMLSHAVDYALWGLNPMGHHLTGIILHAINTFVAVLLVVKLLQSADTLFDRDECKGGRGDRHSRFMDDSSVLITAGLTGLLFGIHPLHVEPAAWISSRKDLIYAFFFMLSIIAYLRYAAPMNTRGVTVTWYFNTYYHLTLGLFILALSGKSMALTLPLVLLIFDWFPLGRVVSLSDLKKALIEKVPFMICSFIALVGTFMAQKAAGALPSLESIPLPIRILVAFRSLVVYLWKMLLPLDLLPLYPYPKGISIFSFEYFVPIVLVCGISATCFYMAKKNRLWSAVWGYYVITLAPVIGIVQIGGHSMADRYVYLASLGPFLLLGLASARALTRMDSFNNSGFIRKLFIGTGALLLSISLVHLTLKQIAVWKNSVALWSHVIEREPGTVPLAYNNRGLAFLSMGQVGRAIEDLNTSISLAPSYYLAYYNRGKAFKEAGKLDLAMEDYNKAIALNPGYADTYTSRGLLLVETGQAELAVQDFTAAITLDPEQYDAYISRGVLFKEIGQFRPAIEDYNKAIALYPSRVEAYNNRGVVYKHMNEPHRAIADYTRAIALSPSFYLAYCNRGIVFGMIGQADKAIEDYTKALRLKPDLIKAYIERGGIYQKADRRIEAAADYQKACDLGSKEGCEALHKYE